MNGGKAKEGKRRAGGRLVVGSGRSLGLLAYSPMDTLSTHQLLICKYLSKQCSESLIIRKVNINYVEKG